MVSLLARSGKKKQQSKKGKKRKKLQRKKPFIVRVAIPIFAEFLESHRAFTLGSLGNPAKNSDAKRLSDRDQKISLLRSERARNQRLSHRRGNEGNRHLETRNILLKETIAAAPHFDKGKG